MANNIITAKVEITGTRPLLFHRFHPDSISLEGSRRERTGVAGNDPEEWRKTVTFSTSTRQLYIDPTYIFGCLRDGAKHTKSGRGSIQSLVAATLQVQGDFIYLDRFMPEGDPVDDRTLPVYMDIRSVKNPATKGRNVRYRVAAATGWKIAFEAQWDKTIVTRLQMESVVNDAGALCGLGDGRSIGFGRFVKDTFEVTDA